jgi:hypothetical protein
MLIWIFFPCFGMWNSCPKFVRTFQKHSVYSTFALHVNKLFMSLSSSETLENGIDLPQGSMLIGTLYAYGTSGTIGVVSPSVSAYLYTDDVTIYYGSHSVHKIEYLLQSATSPLSRRMRFSLKPHCLQFSCILVPLFISTIAHCPLLRLLSFYVFSC